MSRYKIKLIPQNPLFFRDGKPFGGGETFHADTIFPPYPSTFMGMLRTLLIEFNGGVEAFKNGKIEWIGEIEEESKIFKDKGKVLLKYIVINKSDKEVFPIPVDMAKKIKEEDNDEKNCTKDKKTEEIVKFSWVKTESLPALGLGEFKYVLFNKYDDNREPIKRGYISKDDFSKYLSGESIDEYIKESSKKIEEGIYVDEEHIKNSLLRETKQTRDEAGVYMYKKKRLKDDVLFEIVCEIDHENPFADNKEGYIKLGGENGVVKYIVEELKEKNYILKWKEFSNLYNPNTDLLKLVFITPTIPEGQNIIPQNVEKYFNVKGIAVKGTVSIGGWDMVKNMPKDMYKAYTPGTVLLVEPKENLTEEKYHEILETNFSDIKSEEGFGAVVLGIEKNIKNN